MLGLLLIYSIGKKFYDLAELYEKKKWLYVLLALLVYYGSMFFLVMILAVVMELVGSSIEGWSELALSVLGIALGVITVVVFYNILKKKWKNQQIISDTSLLDDSI